MVSLIFKSSKSNGSSGIYYNPRTGRFASAIPGLKLVLPEQNQVRHDAGSLPFKRQTNPVNPAAVAAAASASATAQRSGYPDTHGHYHRSAIRTRESRPVLESAPEMTGAVYEHEQIIIADQVDRPLRFQREHLRDAWHTGLLKQIDGQEIPISRSDLSHRHVDKQLAVTVIHLARQRAMRMAA